MRQTESGMNASPFRFPSLHRYPAVMNRTPLAALVLLPFLAGADTFIWNNAVTDGYFTEPANWLRNGTAAGSAPHAGDGDIAQFENSAATVRIPDGATQAFREIQITGSGDGSAVSFAFGETGVLRADTPTAGTIRINQHGLHLLSGTIDFNGRDANLQNGAFLRASGASARMQNIATNQAHYGNYAKIWNSGSSLRMEEGAQLIDSNFYQLSTAHAFRFYLRGTGTLASNLTFQIEGSTNEFSVLPGARLLDSFFEFRNDTLESNRFQIFGGAVTNSRVTFRGNHGDFAVGRGSDYNAPDLPFSLRGNENNANLSHSRMHVNRVYFGDGNSTNNHFTAYGGSRLTTCSLMCGIGSSAENEVRFREDGTELVISNPGTHINENGLAAGYGAAATATPCRNRFILEDGARATLLGVPSIRGVTIGVCAGAYGNAVSVRNGAVLSNACMTVIGNNHAYWGGGSGGRLTVSNAVFYGGSQVFINGGSTSVPQYASTNNTFEVLDGARVILGDHLFFGAVTNTGNGIFRCHDAHAEIRYNVRVPYAQAHGPSRFEIGGETGTVQVYGFDLVDSGRTELILAFRIAAGGRPGDTPFLTISDTAIQHAANPILETWGMGLDLNIDRTWAESGRGHTVTLLSAPNTMNLTEALENLVATASPEALGSCRLEITPASLVLRAGFPPETLLLLR